MFIGRRPVGAFAVTAVPGTCGGGQCIGQCGNNAPNKCGNTCTNFKTDPLNCGQCGEVCNNDEICVDGNCENFFIPACDQCPCNECKGQTDQCCFNQFVDHTVCAAECP